jgi:hypothetical protein
MDLNVHVTLSPDALHQEVAGETVILDLSSETYFGLDEVGTRVWQLLEANGNLQAVYDALLEEYEVDAEQLGADLDSLLSSLRESGLITMVAA